MTNETLIKKIENSLKQVYDPEIPVNIYDLGLIYDIKIHDNNVAEILMTLTAPNCPVADNIVQEVYTKVKAIEGIEDADIQLTFEPPWDISKASELARLQLGML